VNNGNCEVRYSVSHDPEQQLLRATLVLRRKPTDILQKCKNAFFMATKSISYRPISVQPLNGGEVPRIRQVI
jgi:hypothetical protein